MAEEEQQPTTEALKQRRKREKAAWMLRSITTPYEIGEKVSRLFQEESLAELRRDPGDEIITPIATLSIKNYGSGQNC